MAALKNTRKKKMIAQGGLCYYCNLPMWDNALATVPRKNGKLKPPLKVLRCTAEHLHPRSEGGGDKPNNIVAACLYCNNQRHRRKSPFAPDEHRQHVQKRMAAGKWLSKEFVSWSSSA